MNKLKKTVLGITLAGLAFGFSAFSTIKSRSVFLYYKTNWMYMDPLDPNGYQYFSGDRCEPGGPVCSASWDIGINLPPSDGEWLPSTGVILMTGSVFKGHFE